MTTALSVTLAKGLLTMAADGQMPDTYWLTDQRIALAAAVLGMSQTDAREWARKNCVRAERYGT